MPKFQDDLPNPFAPDSGLSTPASIAAFIHSLKWLGLIAIGMGLLIGIAHRKAAVTTATTVPAEPITPPADLPDINSEHFAFQLPAIDEYEKSLKLPLSDVLASDHWSPKSNSNVVQTSFVVETPSTDKAQFTSAKIAQASPDASTLADASSATATLVGSEPSSDVQTDLWPSSTRSVIGILASDDPAMRNNAKRELSRRGLTQLEIGIADVVVSGSLRQRQELVTQMTQTEGIDSRPWLLLMLQDGERDLKLTCVRALARMIDPDVRRALRMHLELESDQTVALLIRDTLNLR